MATRICGKCGEAITLVDGRWVGDDETALCNEGGRHNPGVSIKGRRRFVSSEWNLIDLPEVAILANIQGAACAYSIWQLDDARVVVSYVADGPPGQHSWLWREPMPYSRALMLLGAEIALDAGQSWTDVATQLLLVGNEVASKSGIPLEGR